MSFLRTGLLAALVAGALAVLPALPASAADTDRDGLPDHWERGVTPDGLNLKALGARPGRRDVFLELNYSTRSGPAQVSCAALDRLYAAFRNAPVTNPDGSRGVVLHIDAGKTCPSRKYDLGGASRFRVTVKPGQGLCANPNDLANVMGTRRLRVFHIGGVVADSELCGPEGIATSTDFIVKGQGGSLFFAYVALHELGHVFGTDHRPFNALSVMSGGAYAYGGNGATSAVDFTRYPIRALDETALDEHVGWRSTSAAGDAWLAKYYAPQMCTPPDDGDPATTEQPALRLVGRASGPVDWNCSGAPFWGPDPYSTWIDDAPVAYDVNGDGVIGTVPAVSAEWPRVLAGLGRGRIGP